MQRWILAKAVGVNMNIPERNGVREEPERGEVDSVHSTYSFPKGGKEPENEGERVVLTAETDTRTKG